MIRRPRSLLVSRGHGRRPTSFAVLFAAAFLAGGCVLNGDFGRIRPELVGDNMHDWVGRDATDRRRRADLRIPHHRPGARAARPRLCADRAALQPRPLGQRAARIRLLQRSAERRSRSTAPTISTSCTRSIAARRRRPMRRSSPMRATTSSSCSRSSRSPPASPTWTGGARRASCTCRTSIRANKATPSRATRRTPRSSRGCASR